jgi:mannose-6-phosphate isomerase-like protein (cupin superfamily)
MNPATDGANFRRSWGRPEADNESSSGEFFLLRNGTGPAQDLMEGTLKLENLTHGASASAFDAIVATAEPGVSCWEGKVSGSDRWYHILEGTLDIIIHGVTHRLVAGDSLYLESMVSHIWRNPGSETARALVLSSSPSIKTGQAGAPI